MFSLYAQNSESDYTPSQLISYGFDAPGRMAIDSNDHIYVIDVDNKSIVVYDGQGVYKKKITTDITPVSIAVNKRGQIYVGDKGSGNIYSMNDDGSKSLFYSGTLLPNALTFGFKNILYVTDSEAKEVLGLDVNGNMVLQYSDPNFTFPTGIAFDAKNNQLVVSEHGGIGPETDTYCNQNGGWAVRNYGPNTSIYAFDLTGTLINRFGCFGRLEGQNHRIQGITVGPCGNIYAVDPYLARISVYDANGNFLTNIGQWGYGSGEFDLPIDILFTSDHKLIVSSMDKASLDVFEITVPTPSAQITSADITTCSGSAELEVHFTGTAPWTFTYTIDGDNPSQITTSENPYMLTAVPGWYEITALTDGSAASADCFTGGAMVTQANAPTVTASNSNFDACVNDGSGIAITLTGTPPFKFTYTIDNQAPIEVVTTEYTYSLIPEMSGLYEIIAVNDDGCSGSVLNGLVEVVVNPLPTAEITNGNDRILIREGESTELTIAFTGTGPWTFTYEIDDKNPVSITTDQNPYLLSASMEGTYEVVAISDSYCSSHMSTGFPDIVFDNTTESASASIDISAVTICAGDTAIIPISFTGTAPWTFTYTIDGAPAGEILTDESPYSLIASDPGTYELSALTDGLNNPGTFSGSVEVLEAPEPALDLGPDIAICEGGSTYTLDAGLFDSYLWNDGSTGRTLEVTSEGTYSVKVSNAEGCTATDYVNVTLHSFVNSDFYYDVNRFEVQFVSNATEADAHYWEFGDKTTSTEENPIHTYSKKGNYTVTYTAINDNCGTLQVSKVVSVGSNIETDVVMIYPNPSYGAFTIKITPLTPITSNINIRISSTSGQTIYAEGFDPYNITQYDGSMYIPVNIDSFDKGIYIVYINADNFAEQEKLVLKD
ncbi:PKD domain-containing protein [Aestuariivivens sediminicola]|uniref:PKD domain-containing protein n=1 Tax=Aestuariivivens sediminicola TaxID=2913560 RepID=UPI001F56AADC